ncbi:MAG: hypothetical protein D6680_06315 [Cyanobacteria bacterium J007]|nr:MAG: hypothetical protein D6680_06315 [Cyanobacteria bacterium J007]
MELLEKDVKQKSRVGTSENGTSAELPRMGGVDCSSDLEGRSPRSPQGIQLVDRFSENPELIRSLPRIAPLVFPWKYCFSLFFPFPIA